MLVDNPFRIDRHLGFSVSTNHYALIRLVRLRDRSKKSQITVRTVPLIHRQDSSYNTNALNQLQLIPYRSEVSMSYSGLRDKALRCCAVELPFQGWTTYMIQRFLCRSAPLAMKKRFIFHHLVYHATSEHSKQLPQPCFQCTHYI
jgi:hypothetical protein